MQGPPWSRARRAAHRRAELERGAGPALRGNGGLREAGTGAGRKAAQWVRRLRTGPSSEYTEDTGTRFLTMEKSSTNKRESKNRPSSLD